MWQILKMVGRWILRLLAETVVREAVRELIRKVLDDLKQ